MLLLLLACQNPEKEDPTAPDYSGGLLGMGELDHFPSNTLIQDGHLALQTEQFAPTETPVPVDRLSWRTGFSPVQPALIQLPGVNPEALTDWRTSELGGPVRLYDLTDGTEYPAFAELDAYPTDNPNPILIIRPQQALPLDHHIAVAVTTELAPRPDRFDQILAGEDPADYQPADHIRALVPELEKLGLPQDQLAVAWDWTTGDGRTPLVSALEQVETPSSWSFYRIRNLDDGDSVSETAWRVAQGRFDTTSFLVDDKLLNLDETGHVSPTGTEEAYVYVHIPESVKNAPAGSVPIMVFGHGIFAEPDDHLDWGGVSSPLAVANELGYIIVATRWRGLDKSDMADALGVARDLGQFPMLTERMVQGQANTHALLKMVQESDFLNDPIFAGADGQLIGDPSRVTFYGVSMGGIEGGVFVANHPEIHAAGLHITGSVWSTLLERSAQWTFFEPFVVTSIPDPHDRQRMYALTQLWWDPVDPACYAEDLRDFPVLLQENLGDDLVTNIGTRVLARSIGLPLLSPGVDPPEGLSLTEGPVSVGGSLMSQFDPGLGEPPDGNRPSPSLGTHGATEGSEAVWEQLYAFFEWD